MSRWRADGHDARRGHHRPGSQPPYPPLGQHHGLGVRGPVRDHRARPVLHPHDLGGLPVAHGLEPRVARPLHRARQLHRPGQGPDAPPGVHEHASARGHVPADRPGGRARRGDPAEPEDQDHRLLPHLLPGAVRGLDGRRGHPVRVHLRSQLRDRERRIAGGGAATPGLSPGPLRGPGGAGDRVLLDPVRLQHRDLPRGPPGHPRGGPRGGVDRRRGQMGQVLARHRADRPAGDDLPAGVGPHRRVPVLRPGVHDHERRAPQLDADARLLHLGAGVQLLHGRLRRGRCVRPVLHQPDRDRGRARLRPQTEGHAVTGEQTLQAVPEADLALHRARIEEANRRMRRSGWRRHLPQRGHLVLMPLSIIVILPFVWMFLTSFMTDTEINSIPPPLWPHHLYTGGYSTVLASSDFPYWFLCSLAGYAFARIRFRGSTVMLILLLATALIPFQLTVIPTFVIFHDIGLINTLGALIVPQLTSALGIYLMYAFFQSFPRELEEAGRIDGCSRLQVFWKIVLPLARPALAALGIITFIYAWNDLFWPLIAITSSRTFTVQVGLTTFQGEHITHWSAIMAGTTLTTVPVLLVFLVGQRRFVQAITGAVKG